MSDIKFCHVTFGYQISNPVLVDLNFDIEKNTTTIVLGKNGSGKSTLLKLIMRFETPSHGEIYLNNKIINQYSILEKSKILAYVGQNVYDQFDFTVKDYLLFAVTNSLTLIETPKEEHIIRVSQYVNRFGIDHLLDKRMDRLSGGEKQIVMICRAFIQESKAIILDEPLSALDFVNQNRILNLLKEISNQDKTIILTTHNPNHALYLNAKVIFISNKEIIADGNARDVLNLQLLNKVYGNTVGLSKDHSYDEFSVN